jgi:hypothetical protein
VRTWERSSSTKPKTAAATTMMTIMEAEVLDRDVLRPLLISCKFTGDGGLCSRKRTGAPLDASFALW